ncbi:hypothetical protein [Paraburkholderia elongata]|uniref:Uncharacterized protein n=1 Tax=Paraburkholderia elongata TaxID=2675747 RepID=A0A972SGT9_9BURK|nr:hypothetical protein [Paraburkholderia elongata]NPT54207.1 hypothetical protein [Paraburkholderia elongata]
MRNKDPKGFITAEVEVASACTAAVSARKSYRAFAGSDPTDDGLGPVSIVTPNHEPPAADRRGQVASLSMTDATDAAIPGID